MIRKAITINSFGLTNDVQLLLTFVDLSNDQLWRSQFPVAWKVVHFASDTTLRTPTVAPYFQGTASVIYESQLAVSSAQIESGNIVSAATYKAASLGDIWSLTFSNNTYKLALDSRGTSNIVNVLNATGSRSNIGFGFIVNNSINVALVQKNVGNTNVAKFLFTPRLRIYATSNFVENEVLTSEVVSPLLWDQNLLALGSQTTLGLYENADGSYVIRTLNAFDASAAATSSPVIAELSLPGGGTWKFFNTPATTDVSGIPTSSSFAYDTIPQQPQQSRPTTVDVYAVVYLNDAVNPRTFSEWIKVVLSEYKVSVTPTQGNAALFNVTITGPTTKHVEAALRSKVLQQVAGDVEVIDVVVVAQHTPTKSVASPKW